MPIDLPTALRLAGAEHLDVRIAQQKLAEAQARDTMARNRMFPWIAVGATAQRHENNIQTVEGQIIDADKQSLAAGLALNARWEPAESYFQRLVARQRVQGEQAALETQGQAAVHAAALAYFDLLRATVDIGVAQAALDLSDRHLRQVQALGEAGLIFAGDVQRTTTHRARSALSLRQAQAQAAVASARLAEVLKLDPAVELTTPAGDLVPLSIAPAQADVDSLIGRALGARPELGRSSADLAAAQTALKGARFAPLIPTVTAQAALGGLGGAPGTNRWTQNYGSTTDYSLGLSWRLGPGGLFDHAPERVASAQLQQAELELERTRQSVRRQVVEQHALTRSLLDQLGLIRQALIVAENTAQLSLSRREQGVAEVLEDIVAKEELTRARHDYAAVVAQYNQAQFGLLRALGGSLEGIKLD